MSSWPPCRLPRSRMSFWERQCCIRPALPASPRGFTGSLMQRVSTRNIPCRVVWGAFSGFGVDTVYLSPAPLYHAAPLHYNIMVLGLGGTSLIMEHFDPEQSLSLIERYEATHSQWVPIMFVRMLKLPESARTQYDLSSMKCAIHAAAPCPIDVKEAMIDWWGPVIVEYYSGVKATVLPSLIRRIG